MKVTASSGPARRPDKVQVGPILLGARPAVAPLGVAPQQGLLCTCLTTITGLLVSGTAKLQGSCGQEDTVGLPLPG